MNDDTTRTSGPFESGSPERIGPYRILQKVGEGGMGEVYEAEQEKPVRRKVALKLIKWGMDTKQVVARFESERQALALMDHPGIAKVLDAGATEQGRPYFAMEYVKGEPITKYCDKHRLSTRERLKLFMQVCEGVQHAHQKGIIHRDLKPTNVLVAIQENKPVPKIIDFGVAKATEQRLTEKTVFTQMGVLVGTPEYMSPEQAEMTGLDIDTRTDVYSLGVMLYELLVGALPFDSKELRKAGFDEIRRKIREDEPSKPSTRLNTLGDASKESAAQRRTDLPTLKRQLHGDLDWITMKALDKDRTRRYGSPSELAAEVERHLNDEPVQASPPSTAYRAKKFVRRHKVGVAAGLVVMFALLAGIVGTTFGLVRASRAEEQAKQEAAAAEKVSDFLIGLFEVSDPSEARGNTITAREILDKGAKGITEGLSDQPELQARLMATMGVVYRELGLYSQAEPLLDHALKTQKRVLGDDHPETLPSKSALAKLYYLQGRSDEGAQLNLEILETRKRVLGDDHPETLHSMNNLALMYLNQGRYDEAEPLCLENLKTQKRVLGDDHPETLRSMHILAGLYVNQGRHDEAEPLYLEALETKKRVFGDDHPDTLNSMNNVANLYLSQGRDDEAEPLYLETIEIQKRVLGDDHPRTLAYMNNLALLYQVQGRYDEAEPLLVEILEARKRILGDDHPTTLSDMNDLALLYLRQGRYDEAEPLYLRILEARKHVLGDDHPSTLWSIYHLGCVAALRGDRAAALNWLRQSVEAGYTHADHMALDPHLASLHGDPEFEAIVAEVKKRVGQEDADVPTQE
jgi:non-specific serine/threonine protein kinase/serine/threonine-protein kinase